MQRRKKTETRKGLLLCLFVLGMVTALTILPYQFRSSATAPKGLVQRTVSADPDIPKMWDIRESKESIDDLARLRDMSGKSASLVADIRDGFVRGESAFKQTHPTAKIDYNLDIRIPELMTPDVYRAKVEWLTPPSSASRVEILRNFVKQNNELIGITNQEVDGLKVAADYTNPDGNLSYVHLEQKFNNIPVFRGEVKAGFTKNGEIIRVINNLAPGVDASQVSRTFNNPLDAVRIAAQHIKHELRPEDVSKNEAESTDLKAVFGGGDWATTAEKMYFPTEPGVAVPSWRVLIWRPINAYYVIVDAQTGIVLWHKNIADDQTQAATYNVYANAPSYINTADHAAPLSPYISVPPNDPTVGAQGVLGSRTNQTLIGNEGPLATINQLGWINDNTNITDGNANEAGVDRVAPNGVDAPMVGDTACPGAGCRVFSSTWNPPPGMPAPGDDPLTPQAQRGAVIQMFYIMNKYHDELYLRGFTEAARNFQGTNFTGMGIGNDRVSSEGQDSSGTNNANFATPADGGRGRMQMFLWTGPTSDRDGTADADIVIHEVTHGTSNRLHGNGSGLGNQGGMMGEGWGDWYAHTMLAEPTDSVNGIYGLGGYSLLSLGGTMTSNYYYGIRRFPTALIASTGGPMNKPHNPLTFGHLNAGCDATLGTTATAVSSAYPRNPVIATSGNCSQVHNAGEIWKSALWEVRSLFIARNGFATGTRDVLQAVTDGMKLTPINPNMLQERDGIIAAAAAMPLAPQNAGYVLDVREGFRRRGFGFSASVTSATVVTEAFDSADLTAGNGTVTSGNFLLEPNECNTMDVPVTNNSGNPATAISAVLSSATPGVTITQPNSAYADLAGGASGTNTTPFQVSLDNTVACFSSVNFTLTVTFTGAGGGSPHVKNFSLPVGQAGLNYVFTPGMGTIPAGGTLIVGSQADDAAVAVPLPMGWSSTVYDVAVTSLSASTNGQVNVNGAANTAFTNAALPTASAGAGATLFPLWDDMDMDPADVTNGGIYTQTTGMAPNRQFIIEWRGQHFAESTNGPINVNYALVLTEGTSNVDYIYALTGVAANANGASATVGVQKATTGTTFTQHSFNSAVITPGLKLSGVLPGGVCTPGTGPCGPAVPDNPRADFDGDGRTDLSVFRPSEGNWYLQGSTAGFSVINWGTSTDVLIPGDYDGDGKADTAVFRASSNPADSDYLILKSNGFVYQGLSWGVPDDVPVSGDYDGDGKTDLSVFRPSTNVWYVLNSSNGSNTVEPFGSAADVPLAIDIDGDGKTNLAIYRPSENTWYIAKPTGTPATNFVAVPFGTTGDRIAHADFDGDGKDDIAVFRPSDGTWYIRKSSDASTIIQAFGTNGDVPVPGDYDGDGKDDVAVYRAGTWHVLGSTAGYSVQAFGVGSDIPVPNRYLPIVAGGGGGAVTVSFNGATAIPDNVPAGVNIPLIVAGVGTVADMNFSFDNDPMGTCDATVGDVDCGINHSWVGDIIIKITPPDGSPTVTIYDRPGVPVPNTVGCSNNNLGNILLNDEGGFPSIDLQGNPTPGACNTALQFPTGNFSPFSPMSAFDGENADGTWTINVSDNAGADTGTVRRFSFIFNSGN
ncbi:MAG: M36 family metallopeptidase [Acidobacteria bacterium]|nr:M36 family metallopeptidase [Acidobacteriota bacterium]